MCSRNQWEYLVFQPIRASVGHICLCSSSCHHVSQGCQVFSHTCSITSSLLLSLELLTCLEECMLACLQLIFALVYNLPQAIFLLWLSLPLERQATSICHLAALLTPCIFLSGLCVLCWIGMPLDFSLLHSPVISGLTYHPP